MTEMKGLTEEEKAAWKKYTKACDAAKKEFNETVKLAGRQRRAAEKAALEEFYASGGGKK